MKYHVRWSRVHQISWSKQMITDMTLQTRSSSLWFLPAPCCCRCYWRYFLLNMLALTALTLSIIVYIPCYDMHQLGATWRKRAPTTKVYQFPQYCLISMMRAVLIEMTFSRWFHIISWLVPGTAEKLPGVRVIRNNLPGEFESYQPNNQPAFWGRKINY